jgi:four helix bundle protein
MNEKARELQARTQRFAAAVIVFCAAVPESLLTRDILEQLLDSAGATDSNYRAACRSRSPREFLAKIGVAAEEADESKGWLELLVASKQATTETAGALIQEADELTAIFVKSRKTAETNLERRDRLSKGRKRRDR